MCRRSATRDNSSLALRHRQQEQFPPSFSYLVSAGDTALTAVAGSNGVEISRLVVSTVRVEEAREHEAAREGWREGGRLEIDGDESHARGSGAESLSRGFCIARP